MKAIDTLKDRLLDIELPVPPPEAFDYTPTIFSAIAITIVIACVIFVRRSLTFRNKRLLRALNNNLTSSHITPKQAMYTLAGILRTSHKTKYLRADKSHPKEWDDFVTELSTFRYQAIEGEKDNALKLINQASRWLKVPRS